MPRGGPRLYCGASLFTQGQLEADRLTSGLKGGDVFVNAQGGKASAARLSKVDFEGERRRSRVGGL